MPFGFPSERAFSFAGIPRYFQKRRELGSRTGADHISHPGVFGDRVPAISGYKPIMGSVVVRRFSQ